MKKIYFLFGVHNHQPIGNFEDVFEKAYNQAYKPFIEILTKYSQIKFGLHCSGVLWNYFKEKHPEYIDTVKILLNRKQIELLTGGYYEPILPSIPDNDKIGQIKKMNEFIKNEFKFTSKGLWLTERIWEQSLIKILSKLDVKYITVDDFHFIASGYDEKDLNGYFITEQEGYKLKIFPISQKLRYYIPFKPPEYVIEFFYNNAKENEITAFTMFDDGEKFGLWPQTYKHVYENKWLEKFLDLVCENSSWLTTMNFSEFIDKFYPKNRVYIPSASYFEMTEWALPVKTQKEIENVMEILETNKEKEKISKFIRGGIWHNFLVKYPEANNMHKKMLYVSEKVNKNKRNFNKISQDLLWQGQCNCAYWHGIFGGLYLPHLRNAVYEKLIYSEKLLDKKNNKLIETDFNCDGKQELIIETEHQNLYIAPGYGGSIYEWDIKDFNINLLNVLSRKEEAYHTRLKEYITNRMNFNKVNDADSIKTIHELIKVKEKNLQDYLFYDWYQKYSLLDHFLHPDTKYENFMKCQYGEQGDFILGSYDWNYKNKKLTLKRKGNVWIGEQSCKIEIEKTIQAENNIINIFYKIKNLENFPVNINFGPEFNFSFLNFIESDFSNTETFSWKREDRERKFSLNIEINAEKKVNLWSFPLYTVSLSEDGFEKTYQGTTVFFWWNFDLPFNSLKEFSLKIYLKNL